MQLILNRSQQPSKEPTKLLPINVTLELIHQTPVDQNLKENKYFYLIIHIHMQMQMVADISGGAGGVFCMGISLRVSFQKSCNWLTFDRRFGG